MRCHLMRQVALHVMGQFNRTATDDCAAIELCYNLKYQSPLPLTFKILAYIGCMEAVHHGLQIICATSKDTEFQCAVRRLMKGLMSPL